MIRWMAWAIAALLKPKALLVAENLCLRQQLVVLQRRQPRPRLLGADRRFWILARQWYSGWRDVLLIVQPETVLRWHREGWRAYWRWRSRPRRRGGRQPIAAEVRALIRRMASENRFWGQRRIQAELVRLGFKVSARTVAKYMRRPYAGKPSPGWRAVSQAACPGYLGLRFLLRADDLVPDLLCLLCDPSCQPRGPACPGNSPSHSRMGGATDRRMLRLGS